MTALRRKTDPPARRVVYTGGWRRSRGDVGPFGVWDEVHDEAPFRAPSLADCLSSLDPMTVGRSYTVRAYDRALAVREARLIARTAGHPAPESSVLWVERIGVRLYEVVISEGGHIG